MKLTFYVRHNYGTAQSYLYDAEAARAVAKLTGRKTVTDSDMAALIALGFSFEQVLPPVQSSRVPSYA